MTKEEFIKLCVVCGYASKKNATEYATGKDVFTEVDIENVHLINERRLYFKNIAVQRSPSKDPEKSHGELNLPSTVWSRIFDTSRGVKR